jgi:hypothetical protein
MICPVPALHEPVNEVDRRLRSMERVLVNQVSNVFQALDCSSGHENALDFEARGSQEPSHSCSSIMAMAKQPNRIQRRVERAGVRCREIQLTLNADDATRLSQCSVLTVSGQVFDDVKHANRVK